MPNKQKPISPVNLRKTPIPHICIYGDNAERAFTKLVWDFIPGIDVKIVQPTTLEALYEEAMQSAMVFIVVKDANNANLQIAETLSNISGIVADVIAITTEQDIRARLHMLSSHYDAIYNLDIVTTVDFKKIFLHKLKKGISRLNFRLQEDEYESFLGFLSVSADSFIVFDRNKRLYYASAQYLNLFPDKTDLFVRGTPLQKIFEIFRDQEDLSPQSIESEKSLYFWTHLKGEHEFQTTDGTHWRMTAVDLPNGHGKIVSTTNVTTYKEHERILDEKQNELERALSAEQEASSLQKQFISMVSHEFRTPLAIVDGNAQILERRYKDLSDDAVKLRLRTIRSAVSRTLNMMQAVLSSNLLKTGKMDVIAEHFSLKDLLKELCREQADLAHDYTILVDIDDIPDIVWMDAKILTLILTNVLANAVKFSSDNPHIEIKAWMKDDEISISVLDRGVGIPAAEIDKIFNRFYRATTAQNIAGSGVGLSLVKDLVHVHGGRVSVTSEEGAWTQFIVHFPNISPALEQHHRNQ